MYIKNVLNNIKIPNFLVGISFLFPFFAVNNYRKGIVDAHEPQTTEIMLQLANL